jgi:hypothetical protein
MHAARDAVEAAEARHKGELRELEFATLAGQAQHEEDMAESARASARATDQERPLQLDRISALLLEIIDVARDEARNPPTKRGAAITGTRLTAMLLRLANAVEVLRALGGPVPGVGRRLREERALGGIAGNPLPRGGHRRLARHPEDRRRATASRQPERELIVRAPGHYAAGCRLEERAAHDHETNDEPAAGFHNTSIAAERTHEATSRSGQKCHFAGISAMEPAGIEPATSCLQTMLVVGNCQRDSQNTDS